MQYLQFSIKHSGKNKNNKKRPEIFDICYCLIFDHYCIAKINFWRENWVLDSVSNQFGISLTFTSLQISLKSFANLCGNSEKESIKLEIKSPVICGERNLCWNNIDIQNIVTRVVGQIEYHIVSQIDYHI